MDDVKTRLMGRPHKMNILGKLGISSQVSSSLCGSGSFTARKSRSVPELLRLNSTGDSVDSTDCGFSEHTETTMGQVASFLVPKFFHHNSFDSSMVNTNWFCKSKSLPGGLNDGCSWEYKYCTQSNLQSCQYNTVVGLHLLPVMACWFCRRKPQGKFETQNLNRTNTSQKPLASSNPTPQQVEKETKVMETPHLDSHEEFNKINTHPKSNPTFCVNHQNLTSVESRALTSNKQLCDRMPSHDSPLQSADPVPDQPKLQQVMDTKSDSLSSASMCKKLAESEQKKKRGNRPSKKKRMRLQLKREDWSNICGDTKTHQSTTSFKVVVGIKNVPPTKNQNDNDPCSTLPKTKSTCSKFSLFISGADLDSGCESSDFEDASDDSESELWNTLSQAAFTNSPFHLDHQVKVVCQFSNKSKSSNKSSAASTCVSDSLSQAVVEANIRWRRCYGSVQCKEDHQSNGIKVSFASEQNLVQTTVFEDDTAERKGPWEEMARDRARFQNRIRDVEKAIGHVLQSSHRDYVYATYITS